MPSRTTFLVDNGSLAPAATLRLRELAAALATDVGEPVEAVSLLHSSAIPAEQLGGRAAEILEPALARRLAAGVGEFLVLPLFFGPSRALTEYVPERVAHLRAKHPQLRVRVAPTLFAPDDDRLAQILADHVCAAAATAGALHDRASAGFAAHVMTSPDLASPATGASAPVRVALVDHGSPVQAVTAVRDSLARQLGGLMGRRAIVVACSMERRPGPEYAFNEPLLETLLAREGWNRGRVVVAMQFLLAGRHAGPDGDVAHICRRAEVASPGLQTQLTPLVGDHAKLVQILSDRWRDGWTTAPLR